MQGTVKMCLEVGYTQEQAELIGKMDDLFEEAAKLDLCTGDEAESIGHSVGVIFGRHTGKLN
jgi:hypothetical protein